MPMGLFKALFRAVAISALALSACGGGGGSTPAPVATLPPPPPPAPPPPPPPPPQASGERYVDKLFDNVDRISNIGFGTGNRTGENQALEMDIYVPEGDTEKERPVVILAFGGGFVSGFRRDPLISTLATDFAQRGYVTASIDYRLFEEEPNTEDDLNIAIIEAMHDMKAAVRFFRQDANTSDIYGTRGDRIFVGGVSAGGIMASFSGALDIDDDLSDAVLDFLNDNNGVAGNSSDNITVSSDVQGVFSISGAVTDFLWIDENSAPIYAAHEEFDTTVPCRFGTSSQGAPFAGGCDMVPRAQSFGIPAELYLVEGSNNHVGYSIAQYNEFLDEAAVFFEARLD